MQLLSEYRKFNDLKESVIPFMICFAATLFFFYEFIQGNMFASIAANIMQDYQIEANKMAYLSSVYYLANVIFLFVAGIVLDRFSIKNTLLIAMFFCVMSTLVLSWSHSFYLALVCRFVTGIGSAFCFLGPVRLASQWFPPRRMAFVTGIIVTVAMTGGMLAQYPLTKLILYVGWRQAVQDIGILGFTMLLFMMFWIQEKPQSAPKHNDAPMSILTAAKKAYLNTQYLKAALYTSLMNMIIAVFGAMMGTLYLEQRLDINSEQAAFINGMLFLGAIIGAPVVGWMSDKIGLRIMPMKLGAVCSLLTLLVALYIPVSIPIMSLLFFLMGFFTSSQVISYALVAESSSPRMTATAVSVVSIITQGGYFIYQNIFSSLLTLYGGAHLIHGVPNYFLETYQHAIIILPLGLLVALLVLFGLKETYCSQVEH